MPQVLRLRSVWGIEAGEGYAEWAKWFPELKKQGYHGVEIDTGNDTENRNNLHIVRKLCDDIGLEIGCVIFTSWPKCLGPRPDGQNAESHLRRYREQLEIAKTLRPVKINAQSGSDSWPVEESIKFYQGTFAIDAEFGLEGIVCHETHRNRSLFNPYVASTVIKAVPGLQMTADFSHWTVVCERMLNAGEEDKALMKSFLGNVNHIHTRIGTAQSSQCPDPINPIFENEREFFEDIWNQCIETMVRTRGANHLITFVPEYGPFPYQAYNATRHHSEVADAEGARLQTLFERVAANAAGQ